MSRRDIERAIWERALKGKGATLKQALTLYADPSCWKTIYDKDGCHWTWNGIVVPPFELAQNALKDEAIAAQPSGSPSAEVYAAYRAPIGAQPSGGDPLRPVTEDEIEDWFETEPPIGYMSTSDGVCVVNAILAKRRAQRDGGDR